MCDGILFGPMDLEWLRLLERPMTEKVTNAIGEAMARQVDRDMLALAGIPIPSDDKVER